MAKQTIVSIHEVDEAGLTGPRVGEGSLIAPLWVLVHPPLSVALSADIAAEKGPMQLRVGLRSDPAAGPLIEIIDAQEAVVFGALEPDRPGGPARPLVGVKLRTQAVSPHDRPRMLSGVGNVDAFVALVVPVLESGDPNKWTGGDDKTRNVFLCGLLGIFC